MTLDTLLVRSGIDNYNQHLWFHGASLKGNQLYITGGPDEARYIRNCWGQQLTAHVPDLQIRLLPQPVQPPTGKPSRYAGTIKGGPWRDGLDLLDS